MALEALSPGVHDGLRAQMEAKICELKWSIIQLKPLDGQLAGAQQAHERAMKRRQAAVEAAQVAQKEIEAADKAAAEAEAEIEHVKSLTSQSQETTPQNCLDSLEASCASVLASMSSSSHVSEPMVMDTRSHMQGLISGLKALSQAIRDAEKPLHPENSCSSVLPSAHSPAVTSTGESGASGKNGRPASASPGNKERKHLKVETTPSNNGK